MKGILASGRLPLALALVTLTALTLIMFGDLLFSPDGPILSKKGLDLSTAEMFLRDFEFRELKNGNFPLWNPHLFSGVPFFDGVQSTTLYPLNYLHLLFPLPQAINIGIALHTFLIGFFMYLWTSHRRLHPLACTLSALLIMFSGAYFMHIYAGHLGNLCAMAWAPLLFLSIDGLLDRPSVGWCLLGIFAVTMQVLATQPQYVYYTALTAGIYCSFSLIKTARRGIFLAGLLAIFLGSLLLSSVQIFSGIQSAKEGIRNLGVSFQFSSMFSFPPENFLTMLSPFFFGDMTKAPYWGRCYLWEMSLFIGVTGFFLAIYGALYGEKHLRRYSVTMAAILLLISLGAHTPLFNLLYHYLPWFNKFRGTSKFIFPASLFFSMLAGIGMDSLIKHPHVSRKFILALFAAGGLLVATAPLISTYPNQWSNLMQAVQATGESYLSPQAYLDAAFIENAGRFASAALNTSGIICLMLSLFLLLRKYTEKALYCVVIMACAEVLVFAAMNRPVFDIRSVMLDDFKRFYAEHPGDYRVLNQFIPNMALSTDSKDIGGYFPVVLKRYAQFIAFTQGTDPDRTMQITTFRRYHPLFRMLRCRYVIIPRVNGVLIQEVAPQILPRLLLIQDWQTLSRRNDIFKEMAKATFDPLRVVILESDPVPQPERASTAGMVAIEESSTDSLRIRGKLGRAAILLITDSYSSGWRVRALPGSVQQNYRVMPANYTLMAIPLSAGEHRLILEYKPRAFLIGKWLSLFSLGIYIIVLICYLRTLTNTKGKMVSETGNYQKH
ncbi:MAG TPA: hypothetical protein VJZ49_10405 [Syntrophales bacterium]|nr:hypothetical protein [Syntrophales bacterium]